MAILGGIAMSAWKHPRFTRDIDILIAVGESFAGNVIKRLADEGIRAKSARPTTRVGDVCFVQLIYEPPELVIEIQID